MSELEDKIKEGFTSLLLLSNFLSNEDLREHIVEIQKEVRNER